MKSKRIKTDTAIRKFKNKTNLARALGVSKQAVGQWGEFLPPLRAFEYKELLKQINIQSLIKRANHL
jgi:DNA-binding XRE family transcriptional regulator